MRQMAQRHWSCKMSTLLSYRMLFNNWNLISTEIILYSLKLALEELRLNLAFKFIQIESINSYLVLEA